jgi:hypothetical protein
VPACAHTDPAAQSLDAQQVFVQKRPAFVHAAGTMPEFAQMPVVHTESATQAAPSGALAPAMQRFDAASHAFGAGQFALEQVYTSGGGPLSVRIGPASPASQRPATQIPLPQSAPSSTSPSQSSSMPSHASSSAWHVAQDPEAVQ